MVRKLKFHEQKLLKKVDFISWKIDSRKENIILRKYHVRRREDYSKYNTLARKIRDLSKKILQLQPCDPFKSKSAAMLLERLYNLGVTSRNIDLGAAEKVSASSFCRRRLPIIMTRANLSQNVKSATNLIEQGHVRVGPDIIKNPAYIVPRNLEDFVTWVNNSAIKKHILEYKNERDDFEM